MYPDAFIAFLEDLKTPNNASLIESIHKGYQTCFESIEYRHSNESEKFLNKFNVTEDDLNYLGSGDFGSAYTMGNGKVLKITSSKSEFDLANEIMNRKNLSNLATIFGTAKTPSGYLIVLEELNQTQDIEEQFYNTEEILNSQYLQVRYIDHFDEEEYEQKHGQINPETKKFMNDMYQVVFDYKQITGETSDIRPENLGRSKDGTLKAFDVDEKRKY